MSLRVIGAGLGRTGTTSLKTALERLLGGPCHHMIELFAHPDQVSTWHAATRGEMPDWKHFLSDYAATVDWPSAAFWPEISEAFPDAILLLSVRDPESWWKSASATIFQAIPLAEGPWRAMVEDMMRARFTSDLDDRAQCIAAYEAWYTNARARIPRDRLLEWRASDGWAPICHALGLPIPSEPFPHANTTEDFQAMVRAGGPRRDGDGGR